MNILILGDGNFSFSLALAGYLFDGKNDGADLNPGLRYLGLSSESPAQDIRLFCTSFDTRSELLEKYPETEAILEKIQKYPNTTLMHRVNAWELSLHFDHAFHVIIWNHPHLGTEDFRLHRFLMSHFLNSAKQVLSGTAYGICVPKICVSLVEGQDIRWDLLKVTKFLKLKLLDLLPLRESDFPGYICKRNKNGQSFKNQHTLKHMDTRSKMKSFVFRLVASEEGQGTAEPDLEEEIAATMKQTVIYDREALCPVVIFDPILDTTERKTKKLQRNKKIKDHVEAKRLIYKCPDCPREYPTLRGIREHYHTVHVLNLYKQQFNGEEDLKCQTCGRMFKKQQDLQQHQISKHSALDTLEMSAIFGNLDESSKDDEKSYVFYPCEICGQSVLNRTDGMILHLESLKPLVGQVMACPLGCAKTFLESRALEQHYKMCRTKV